VTNPYGDGSDAPRQGQIHAASVIGGVILGVVVTFVWLFVVFVAALSLDPNGTTTTAQGVLIFAVFVLPFVAAIVLLCFRRTRQAGAGLVMGMAIGSLALAGVCGSIVVLPGLG
jgi:uncharacterized membrane protein